MTPVLHKELVRIFAAPKHKCWRRHAVTRITDLMKRHDVHDGGRGIDQGLAVSTGVRQEPCDEPEQIVRAEWFRQEGDAFTTMEISADGAYPGA